MSREFHALIASVYKGQRVLFARLNHAADLCLLCPLVSSFSTPVLQRRLVHELTLSTRLVAARKAREVPTAALSLLHWQREQSGSHPRGL